MFGPVWLFVRSINRVYIWALAILACWLAVSGAIGIIALEGALHPPHRPITEADQNLARIIASRDEATLTEVSMHAQDGAVLRAWRFAPSHPNGDAVILLHGQADNRAGMLGNADLLLRHGFIVLLPDARAHGESAGAIATYGVMEAGDIRKWFEALQQMQGTRCIDGLGDSMGAAQLLNSLSVEPKFCAVVAESSFSDFRSAAYDRMGQEFQTGPWLGRTVLRPAVDFGLLYARWKHGVDLNSDSPIEAIAISYTPVLLIHGLADQNLPPYHSERIKDSDHSVVLWEPPNAGHCGPMQAEPDEYERRVVGWFTSHGKSSSTVLVN